MRRFAAPVTQALRRAYALRLALALVALFGAVQLFHWSRTGDPRFYRFLETRPGRTLAACFGWYDSHLMEPLPNRVPASMNREERVLLDKLNDLLENAGGTGRFQVGYRDVLFCQELREMTIHVSPPYLIATDRATTEVPAVVRELVEAYQEIEQHFTSLASREATDDLSHVLLFSRQADYEAYQRRFARLEGATTGFYSPMVDRLVLFDDAGEMDDLVGPVVLPGSEALLTLRHEGAHQFLFSRGVHSGHFVENDWLIEGLATYCETQNAGDIDPDRLSTLTFARAQGTLLPLAELLARPQTEGLIAYKPAELAYSQAWSLVHYLMQEETRDEFFDYIKEVRDPASFQTLRRTPRIDILCAHLGRTPKQLQRDWEKYIAELAALNRSGT